MSELDAARRARLIDVLRAGGQSVVTATELSHVPGAEEPGRGARGDRRGPRAARRPKARLRSHGATAHVRGPPDEGAADRRARS